MHARQYSGDATYDVIVVGSGIGGLTAAALLAKAGKKVLVVERHDRPGGCAQTFIRKGCLFDAAVHLTSGCEPGISDEDGLIYHLLRLFKVEDLCSFIRVDPFYTAVFPGFRFNVPLGLKAFIQEYVHHFPKEEKGLRQLIQLSSHLAQEAKRFPMALSSVDAFRLARQFPSVIKYQKFSFGQIMDEYLTDPHLKALFSSLWPYAGLPPSKLPFLYFATVLMNYIEEGSFHCRGSFQNLVNAFVEALRKNNGELFLKTSVSKIVVKDNRVTGVILGNSQMIQAPLVISNTDAVLTFKQLIGFDNLPSNFVKRVKTIKPSISAFILYAVTKQDMRQLHAGHEMFVFPFWDHDENYETILRGMPGAPIITIPTVSDPSLAPKDQHIVTMTQIIPYGSVASWRREKARYIDMLLQEMENVYPGFRPHATYVEGASPQTIERYTLNQDGAMYGLEASSEQTGIRRFSHQSPIPGLYLSGHWTQPGGGIYGVVQSGVQTTQLILGHRNIGALFDALRARDG